MDTSSLTPLTDALVTAVIASVKQSEAPQTARAVASGGSPQASTIAGTSGVAAIASLQTWFHQRQAAVAEQALDTLVHHPDDQASQQQLGAEIVRLASADPTMVTVLQGWAEQATHMQSKDGWCTDSVKGSPCL